MVISFTQQVKLVMGRLVNKQQVLPSILMDYRIRFLVVVVSALVTVLIHLQFILARNLFIGEVAHH